MVSKVKRLNAIWRPPNYKGKKYSDIVAGFSFRKKWEFKFIKRYCEKMGRGEILDYGCNQGDTIGKLSLELGSGYSFTGIDINPEAIEIAREKYPQVNFFVENRIPEDKDYDLVNLQHIIEHFDLSRACEIIGNVNRSLKVDGYAIVLVPREPIAGFFPYLSFLIRGAIPSENPHKVKYSKGELEDLLKSFSFKIEESRSRTLSHGIAARKI